MKFALLALALTVAVLPQPVRAVVLEQSGETSWCSAQSDAIVVMPCAQRPVQLQTMHSSLLKAFVPMNCRPVGVRFQVAGLPVSPGRGAGLIATAVFHTASAHAHLEQMCRPTGW